MEIASLLGVTAVGVLQLMCGSETVDCLGTLFGF